MKRYIERYRPYEIRQKMKLMSKYLKRMACKYIKIKEVHANIENFKSIWNQSKHIWNHNHKTIIFNNKTH